MGGIGRIFCGYRQVVDHEATAEEVRLGDVERHPPGADAAHGRLVAVVGLDGVHAVPPLLGHHCQGTDADEDDENAPHALLLAAPPKEHAHGRQAQKGPARVRAQRRHSTQAHGCHQAHPDPAVLRLGLQVAHERDDHDEGQRHLVIAADEAAWPPDAVVASGGYREETALDAVKANRNDHRPDEDFELAAVVDERHGDEEHQEDLH